MPVSENVKGLYTEAYADASSKWRELGAELKAQNIVRAWQAAVGTSAGAPAVVEIGCGDGAIAAALAALQFSASYAGYELSSSGIKAAQARGISGASFTLVDGERIPRADNSADLVVLSHVVEHLEHPRTLLYEAQRLGKYLAVEVPLELHFRTPRDYELDTLGHINKYNARSIRHLVQSCGFEVLHEFTTNPFREVSLFAGEGFRRRAAWRTKETLLNVAPAVARSLFTYHETIIATRR